MNNKDKIVEQSIGAGEGFKVRIFDLKTGLTVFYSPLIGETGNYYRYINGIIEELEHLPYEWK